MRQDARASSLDLSSGCVMDVVAAPGPGALGVEEALNLAAPLLGPRQVGPVKPKLL